MKQEGEPITIFNEMKGRKHLCSVTVSRSTPTGGVADKAEEMVEPKLLTRLRIIPKAMLICLKSVNAHLSTTAFHFGQNSYCCNVHCLSFFILVAPYTNCENELKTVEGAVKYCTIEKLLINEATSVSVTISEGS